MSLFMPKGIRPPGLFPDAPRVIYKTVRKSLSHEARIERVDGLATLQAFHAFSREFHARRPRLAPDLAAPLHNCGFLPDKGVLFDLANPDRADRYLSDFLARVLPLVNGTRQAAIQDRLVFWRLYQSLLPMAELVGTVRDGRMTMAAGQDDAGPFLTRPAMTADSGDAQLHAHLSDITGEGEPRIVLRLPEQAVTVRLLRIAVIHDPATRLPEIIGAVAIPLDDSLPLWAVDRPGVALKVALVDPDTGFCSPYGAMVRDSLDPPPEVETETAPNVANWWAIRFVLTVALARLPLIGAAQFDVLETGDSGVVIDATDRLDTATLQRHGPIMGGEAAIRFLREFGL